MNAYAELQRATLDARQRTGRKGIGTQVNAGRLQVVDVAFNAKGKATVVPLSGWLPMADAVRFIRGL